MIFRSVRRAKYGNRRTTCLSGHSHDSNLEAGICNSIKLKIDAGEKIHYRTQERIRITVGKIHICDHVVDFAFFNADGKLSWVMDAKSQATKLPAWKMKAAMVMALFAVPYFVAMEKRFEQLITVPSPKHGDLRIKCLALDGPINFINPSAYPWKNPKGKAK